jgi:hypothetical protein
LKITDIEQQTQDFDWFAIDQEGFIGHFAIGGHGALPASVAKSREELERITKFFLEELSANTTAIVDRGVLLLVHLQPTAKAETRYLHGFVEAAERGLYSYDAYMDETRPTGYFRVAVPANPLNITKIPIEIATILQQTKLPFRYYSTARISVEQLREDCNGG